LAYAHAEEVFRDCADSLKVCRTVPALLAAIGLAHDLGNPPFGHQGEVAIQRWFARNRSRVAVGPDFLRFGGNCQTFRLLTRLQILSDEYGLNLTYATLAGLMKYPVFSDSDALDRFGKFGIFVSERDIAEDVWKHTGLSEGVRHPLAYVMEACDDIAYSVIDAEDIVKKNYASFNDLIDFLQSNDDVVTRDVVASVLKKNREFKQHSLSSSELSDLSMQMFRVKAIAEMVKSATTAFVRNIHRIMSADLPSRFELLEDSDSGPLCRALKEFDERHGFKNPAVLRLELQGDNYISEVMDMLWIGIDGHEKRDPFARYAYGRTSENYRRIYDNSPGDIEDKAHLLCDAISGMMEGFLVSLHSELGTLQR